MNHRTPGRPAASAGAALSVLVLAGCAGAPLVDIRAPGQSLQDSGSNSIPAMSLTDARRYLMQVRATYREAMASQTGTTQGLQSGLIGLGALVTGLAAGQAHRDAILGTSLIGGTSFAIGSLTLDKRRVLAFDAGIRALDCANAAVIPLDLDKPARQGFHRASRALAAAIAAARQGNADVQSRIDALAAPALPQVVAAAKSVTAMDAALLDAEKARRSADKLAGDMREAGQRLQATVNEISAKVDGVIVQTVDLAAVQQAVAGLGGFASAFAPGAGLDKSIADALGRYNTAANKDKAQAGTAGVSNSSTFDTQQKADLAALDQAVAALDVAGKRLQGAVADVNALVGSIDSTAVAAALKACNVADVTLPLTLEPSTLELDSTLPRGFAINGGVRPYMVQMLDGAVEGLNISFGGGALSTAQVGASSGVPDGSYRALVSDTAGTRKVLVVTVARAASAATPGAAAAPTAQAVADAVKNLVRSLNDPGFSFILGQSIKVTVKDAGAKASTDGTQVEAPIVCNPANPSVKLKPGDLRDKLLAANPGAAATLKGKDAIVIKPANTACVDAG